MAIVRAHQRIAEELPELQIEALTGRTGMSLTVEESLGRENDENSPMAPSRNVPLIAAVPRPTPRLPLQDITLLFQFNIPSGNSRQENRRNAAGVLDRARRRPLDSPVPSKKRRISEATIPAWEKSLRPVFKSSRPSTGLRSFR